MGDTVCQCTEKLDSQNIDLAELKKKISNNSFFFNNISNKHRENQHNEEKLEVILILYKGL